MADALDLEHLAHALEVARIEADARDGPQASYWTIMPAPVLMAIIESLRIASAGLKMAAMAEREQGARLH